jgi:AraC family transcriptional regulator
LTNVKVIKRFPDINRPGFSFSTWNTQFRDNNVILNGQYSNIAYPFHWTSLSIKCAFNGRENYETSRVKYAVDDRSYLILNEGAMYSSYIDSDSKVESFTVNFKKEFADDVINTISNNNGNLLDHTASEFSNGYLFFEKLYEHDEITRKLMITLRKYIFEPDICSQDRINELLQFLLEKMCRANNSSLYHANEIRSEKRSTRIEIYRRLSYAKDYIQSNYRENISNNKLAAIACLSPYHFLRSFKQVFSLTPHQFLTKTRIKAAKEMLLRDNKKSILAVCQSVGFESMSSFGQLFRKHYGASPEKFRENKQF